MKITNFILLLAVVLILVGIGATHGFGFEVYLALFIAGGRFIADLVREILHP